MNFLFNDLSSSHLITKKFKKDEEDDTLAFFIDCLKLIFQTASSNQPVYWSANSQIFSETFNFISNKSLPDLIEQAKHREIKTALISFQSRLKILDCSKKISHVELNSSSKTFAVHPYLEKVNGVGCAISIFSKPYWELGTLNFSSQTPPVPTNLANIPKIKESELDDFVTWAKPFFSFMAKHHKDEDNGILPKLKISTVLLKNKVFEGIYKKKTKVKNERINAFLTVGTAIAEINDYIYDNVISSKNGTKNKIRRIFFNKKLKKYLSIDLEKGAFEFLDNKGTHLGEFNFFGVKLDGADASGKHNILI